MPRRTHGPSPRLYLDAWSVIRPGSIVLWSVGEGWFPCVVVSVSTDRRMLTLRWRDFRSYRQFQVKRIAVGVLAKIPPAMRPHRQSDR
jgi:hypothetical protein